MAYLFGLCEAGIGKMVRLLELCRYRGIGGWQYLAGGVLVVTWGCLGGAQRSCVDHLKPILI